MENTRRQVLKAGLGSLCVVSLHSREAGGAEAKAPPESMRPLDYGLSFICHGAAFNAVRFWIESRTRILDETAGTCTDYYQCGSCKSEHTFAEQNLFQEENYDFLPIFGGGDVLVFRRPAGLSARYKIVTTAEELWGPPELKLRVCDDARELKTWDEIREATHAALPLVTHTELRNEETGLRAVIECPTKTMNISLETKKYQVDTGPVAFPDLAKRYERPIDCVSLAFVAFNAPTFADFVVEQPTMVLSKEGGECSVYHYSKPFSLPAKNRIFALRRPGAKA